MSNNLLRVETRLAYVAYQGALRTLATSHWRQREAAVLAPLIAQIANH
jgi:hypothetical protein